MLGVKKRERCHGMLKAEWKDDSSLPADDGEAEFRKTLRIVSHGFEGTPEKNVPRLQPFVSYFPRHLGPVLDVGCGVGLMIELLANAGATAVGIDLDSDRVAAAQSRGLRVVTADARDYLAGRLDTFGGIFLRHIVEHFDGVEGVRLLHLCRKALRPGGVVALITPNFEVPLVQGSVFWLDVTHRRPYPLPLLRHIFLTLGLDIVESGCRQDEEEQDLFIVGRVPEGPVR